MTDNVPSFIYLSIHRNDNVVFVDVNCQKLKMSSRIALTRESERRASLMRLYAREEGCFWLKAALMDLSLGR